jgi:RNA polymerase sigma-70 factor (ECF subfamily)
MLSTSATLLDQLRQANQPEAWARFVQLYSPLLLYWAARQGFREADAEDLVQEVLVKLVRELPAYEQREGQSFRGWLFRVTVNQCRDFRRRKATRALPGDEGLSGVSAPSVAELAEAEYRRLLVRRGLELIRADFNDTTWTAFTRLTMEGRSAADVAAELNLSVNAVYLARHRVLARLRQELDGLLD